MVNSKIKNTKSNIYLTFGKIYYNINLKEVKKWEKILQ
ncbi:hypothetical protein BCD72_002661 [Clostridium butyricum]|uniref:Uncharacterized protein n=1 Tax=Clostridium butyricum TaxID=1492 RepID=A0A6N3GHJ4_CLOBU|nr:hypothetical protein CBDKU1_00130 [Clostridium butyricum DKU-01]KIU06391.1 hypothetical protein SC08_Contig83orf00137 [Clostridium butyricum]MBA8966234.1 hypothetical protein [Clostridium butyricum]MBA8972701.1 hypothetical protein [Clostridium butyricum]NOW38115.1 hypothetical protein [Clostridium butyricum]